MTMLFLKHPSPSEEVLSSHGLGHAAVVGRAETLACAAAGRGPGCAARVVSEGSGARNGAAVHAREAGMDEEQSPETPAGSKDEGAKVPR